MRRPVGSAGCPTRHALRVFQKNSTKILPLWGRRGSLLSFFVKTGRFMCHVATKWRHLHKPCFRVSLGQAFRTGTLPLVRRLSAVRRVRVPLLFSVSLAQAFRTGRGCVDIFAALRYDNARLYQMSWPRDTGGGASIQPPSASTKQKLAYAVVFLTKDEPNLPAQWHEPIVSECRTSTLFIHLLQHGNHGSFLPPKPQRLAPLAGCPPPEQGGGVGARV